MKVVKPLRLSVLSRPFALQPGQQRLGVTVIAMTGMAPGQPMLYPDIELWPLVAEEIGAQGVLDLGMPKRSAEFLATGHAYTAHQETPRNRCVARVRVGELEKTLRVSGDRYWLDGRATDPLPFESMPLDWSRAFGGPTFADNPLGIGAEDETVRGVRTRRLPNVELPGSPMHRPDQPVRPASFSALDVMWPERFARIGKAYDAQWVAEGFPGYARDMDWHLFNAAPQDQWWHGADHIPDAAPYAIWNMHPTQACQRGQLPDWRARCFVTRTEGDGEVFVEAPMRLSTAWFFPHRERIVLIYHGLLDIAEDDAADVRHLMPALEDAQAAPLPAEHYRGILRQRLDPETGALHTFRDRDLVPPAAIGPWFDNQSLRDRPIGPLARNATRGAALMREDMRERLIASGQDPDRYALPDESAQALPDLDALPEFVARSRLAQEEARQQLKAQQQLLAERLQANASTGPEAPGADMQQLLALAQGQKTPGIKGPPSAAMTPGFQSMAAAVAAMPAQQAADMAPLADLMQRNATVDASLRKMYLHSAHHQDAADRMEAEPAARLREQVAGRMAASRDFSGMDLTGADLSGMDLRGARFTGAQLESANLDGAQLDDADLSQAVLVRASLHAASLRRACLDGANLGLARCSRTVFAGASLRGTTLEQMHCEDCDFDDTQWEDNTLLEVHMARCSFRRASLKVVMLFEKAQLHTLDFSHAQLFKLTLVGCKPAALRFAEARCEACVFVDVQADGPLDFSGATLRTTSFVGRTSLRQAVFRGAHLRECSLRLMALPQADLSESRLENCDFSECDLSHADLSRADARESRFVRAVLQHASLRDANLIDASLQKADLRFADLRGANLFRADLSQSLVDDSTLLEGAYTRLAKVVPARREGAAVP